MKPIISVGVCLKVSQFSSASIWSTNWVPSIPSFKPRPKYPSNRNFQSLQIKDLIDPILYGWKPAALFSQFDPFSAQEILKTRISLDQDPTYLWTASTSGRFSVSSAYNLIASNPIISNSITLQLWNSLWKLNLNDRLRLFLWKIAWNILPTQERPGQLFHINSDISCPLCKVADDSLQHLLFNCIFARVVWRHSFWPLDSIAFHFSSMLDWIKLILCPSSSLGIPQEDCHKFQIFAFVACDILWFYRNKAFHDRTTFDARNISAHVNKISLEYFQAWHSAFAKPMEKWISPAPN
jgi:hypothetical protein